MHRRDLYAVRTAADEVDDTFNIGSLMTSHED